MWGTVGAPITIHVIQGRKNIQSFVHEKLVADGCKRPVPDDWLAQLKLQYPGIDDSKLDCIQAETHRYTCKLCPHAHPDNFVGIIGHLGGKKHCKNEQRARIWAGSECW